MIPPNRHQRSLTGLGEFNARPGFIFLQELPISPVSQGLLRTYVYSYAITVTAAAYAMNFLSPLCEWRLAT
jgi:hypothetical protein